MATYKITKTYFNGIALFLCTYYKVVTKGYYTGAPENLDKHTNLARELRDAIY